MAKKSPLKTFQDTRNMYAPMGVLTPGDTAHLMYERYNESPDELPVDCQDTLLGVDINPLDEKWQRPSGNNNKDTDNYGD